MPMRSGFWLDETGTYYMISGDWHQFVERMRASLQSPLYCGMLWLLHRAAGSNEILLRVPSVLAMGAAAYLLWRLAARIVFPEAALTAALIFETLPETGHLAGQARPYSLLIAVTLGSMMYFCRWLDTVRPRDGALCIVFLAAAFYFQLTSALMVFVYAIVIAREPKRAWKQIAAGAALLAALCLPVIPYYYSAAGQASTFGSASPGWTTYFELFPGIAAGILIFAIALLYMTCSSVEWVIPPINRRAMMIITVWLTVPPAILLLVTKLNLAKLFVGRYYSYSLPAVALLIAILVCLLKQTWQRLILVSVAAVSLSVATWSTALWPSYGMDWRETSAAVWHQANALDVPVFVRSGFIEANNPQWFNDEVRLDFLRAPVGMYPMPGAVIVLPFAPGRAFDGYMENAVRGLASRKEFFVVDRETYDAWPQWFQSRFGSGFNRETIMTPSGASITRFYRVVK
jgi:4-amino-4-deoxy-L-arabinose transferase-like glycosyltransferase